jgi:hypothetical protein
MNPVHRRIAQAAILFLASTAAIAQDVDRPGLRERLRERIEQRREPAPADMAAGTTEYSLRHGGLTRKYLLHVPARRAPGGALPLVIAFHGGGGHAEYMADDARYGWVSKADREGFAVAFPNGYSKLPGGRFATWNAGQCCGDARDRKVDDVGFVRALVADVRSRLPIDPAAHLRHRHVQRRHAQPPPGLRRRRPLPRHCIGGRHRRHHYLHPFPRCVRAAYPREGRHSCALQRRRRPRRLP